MNPDNNQPQTPQVPPQGTIPVPQPQPTQVAPEAPQQTPQPMQQPMQPVPEAPQQMPEPLEQPEMQQAPQDHIEWQASEFMHHEKNIGWFILLFMATTLIMAVLYLILRDILSVIVIALMAIALGVFANRKPRTLTYIINNQGLSVGDKNYAYDSFRSFSVMDDGAMETIVVDPIQKFMPPITIYCAPDDIEKIVNVLTYYLPHEDKQLDWVDRFAKRIRF